MDKKVKAFFAAMGIATALLVPVSVSADNSDSEVQVSGQILGAGVAVDKQLTLHGQLLSADVCRKRTNPIKAW